MKPISVALLALAVAASASADPEAFQPHHLLQPRIANKPAEESPDESDYVSLAQRMHSIQMAEDSLAHKASGGCFLRTVCAVGTVADEEVPRYSMADGLLSFRGILQRMIVEAESEGAHADQYPNIRKILASFGVGESTSHLSMCEELFPCEVGASTALQEILVARNPDDASASAFQERTTCAAASVVCPGLSIGCALCGAFAPPGACPQCVIAAFYCGVSGYACMAQAAEEAEADRRRHNRMPYFQRRRSSSHYTSLFR